MRFLGVLCLMMLCCWSPVLHAGVPEPVRAAVDAQYAPAQWHRGLDNAQDAIDPDKIRTYVTLVEGGLPAAKAEWFVTNQDYEYRPVVVDTAKRSFKSRRGKVYTHLERGLVMVVAATAYSGNTIYLKLLSADVYRKGGEKHPSRVGIMLGFKFSAAQLRNTDAVISEMMRWVRPFRDFQGASEFAQQLVHDAIKP